MAHFLEYSFDLWSIAERVLVRIPVSAPASEELVFLDYVSPRISSLDQCWLEYRNVAPTNGAFFGNDSAGRERKRFDEMMTLHREQHPPNPMPDNVTVSAISAEELKAHARATVVKAKRSAARQARSAVKGVLHEVLPRLDSVFKSQSGMDGLRLALSLQPITVEPAEGQCERRRKRKLPHGLTMPAAPTVRVQRRRAAEELRNRADIAYLIRGHDGELQAVDECPADDAALVGLLFDLRSQLQRALQLDKNCGMLVSSRPHSGTAQFELVLGEDGITPAIEHVLCIGVRLLDPRRVLFKAGHSRFLRLVVAWVSESGIRDVSLHRNGAVSKLVNERFDTYLFVFVPDCCVAVHAGLLLRGSSSPFRFAICRWITWQRRSSLLCSTTARCACVQRKSSPASALRLAHNCRCSSSASCISAVCLTWLCTSATPTRGLRLKISNVFCALRWRLILFIASRHCSLATPQLMLGYCAQPLANLNYRTCCRRCPSQTPIACRSCSWRPSSSTPRSLAVR